MTHHERMRDARLELARVAAAERTYLDGQPYRLIHRYDPRAAQYTVQVDVTRAVPEELAASAAMVLHGARAALDALAASLAGPAAGNATPRFPIHDSLPVFAQRSRRALAGMSDAAQAEIEALQPYHRFGGFRHDPLWLLRELDMEAPLRLAAGALRPGAGIGVNTKRHVELVGDLRAADGPFEAGALLVAVAATVAGPDPKLDLYFRPDFELALAREGPARGAPLASTLAALCDHVEHEVFARLSS
jgi:hypothetical protein